MTDSLHSHNSKDNPLRVRRHRSLLAKMAKTNANRVKGFASRGRGRARGHASRGRWKRWILIALIVLLLLPAMQVAVVPRKKASPHAAVAVEMVPRKWLCLTRSHLGKASPHAV